MLTRLIAITIGLAAGVACGAPSVIWKEAETLEGAGGWSNDSQHVDIMGSPYLLATGVGRPVEDAVGMVEVKEAGSYRLWVRCRDWYPSHSPGVFGVVVAGKNSEGDFGRAKDDAWQWIDGGVFELESGEVELRLTDLTGWWGRCDAIVLAADGFKPSNDVEMLAKQRLEHAGVSPEIEDAGEFDVVVVGGGSAGLGAAIAAARNGIRVAFIQDRPVLGGNGSSEIQVPPMGWIGGPEDVVNVTGIAEELYPVQGWTNFADSGHIGELVAKEKNISLFLNTRATGVEMVGEETIGAVLALDVQSGRRLRFSSPLFIDTTGHGWIGYYAGAEWRMGTEARAEFGESLAPLDANPHTMGNSLYRADFREMGKPEPFETPEWAYQWDSPSDFNWPVERFKKVVRPEGFDKATRGPGRPVSSTGLKRGGAYTWFVENGGMMNTIDDAERIRDELFRIHIGLWGYVKNKDPKGIGPNRNLRMVWLNYVPGVRESRRLMGDYLMTQEDFDEHQSHSDTVAFTDWGIDDHQPHGFFVDGIDAIHVYGGKRIAIPYRSLYSKNIGNLFMAGRCMSASHMALGGVRVQRPMVATGQVVGTAAVIATRHRVAPRDIYAKHIGELQQTLLKDGCFIPGVKNEDPLDLARKAETRHPSLVDGWNRELKGESKPVPWRGAPLEFEFAGPTRVATVQVSLANRHHAAAFIIEGSIDGQWTELARTAGARKMRRHVVNCDPVVTDRVRLRLLRATGAVSVAEVRIYGQPGVPTDDRGDEALTTFEGIAVDDVRAEKSGHWTESTWAAPVLGPGYQHDDGKGGDDAHMEFIAELPKPGIYEVRIGFHAHSNRASNVPVTVHHEGGAKTVMVDQKKPPLGGKWVSLGKFKFGVEGTVELSNEGTDGHVIADGVQWLPVE